MRLPAILVMTTLQWPGRACLLLHYVHGEAPGEGRGGGGPGGGGSCLQAGEGDRKGGQLAACSSLQSSHYNKIAENDLDKRVGVEAAGPRTYTQVHSILIITPRL